ncbi:hypothetical protein HRG_012088 [Hirsutella rhossiliensis]
MKPLSFLALAGLVGTGLALPAAEGSIDGLKRKHDLAHCIVGTPQIFTHPEDPFQFVKHCFNKEKFGSLKAQHDFAHCVVGTPQILTNPQNPWEEDGGDERPDKEDTAV